jgi:hypothetical protein
MKTVILTALVLILEVGFIASIAFTPAPRGAPQAQSEVVAGRNATTSPSAAPASRS